MVELPCCLLPRSVALRRSLCRPCVCLCRSLQCMSQFLHEERMGRLLHLHSTARMKNTAEPLRAQKTRRPHDGACTRSLASRTLPATTRFARRTAARLYGSTPTRTQMVRCALSGRVVWLEERLYRALGRSMREPSDRANMMTMCR